MGYANGCGGNFIVDSEEYHNYKLCLSYSKIVSYFECLQLVYCIILLQDQNYVTQIMVVTLGLKLFAMPGKHRTTRFETSSLPTWLRAFRLPKARQRLQLKQT